MAGPWAAASVCWGRVSRSSGHGAGRKRSEPGEAARRDSDPSGPRGALPRREGPPCPARHRPGEGPGPDGRPLRPHAGPQLPLRRHSPALPAVRGRLMEPSDAARWPRRQAHLEGPRRGCRCSDTRREVICHPAASDRAPAAPTGSAARPGPRGTSRAPAACAGVTLAQGETWGSLTDVLVAASGGECFQRAG